MSQALATEDEGLCGSVGNGDAISEVTGLSTGTIVGRTMRGDEALHSKHKHTRYSYNTMHKPYFTYQIPASNVYMYYNSQELPRKNKQV